MTGLEKSGLLSLACRVFPELPWATGLQARLADRLGLHQSTVKRRFGSHDDFSFQLADRVTDPAAGAEGAWVEQLRAVYASATRQADTLIGGFANAFGMNWDLADADDQYALMMTLWSRIGSDAAMLERFERSNECCERVTRLLLHDSMNLVSERLGRQVGLRPGITDREVIFIFDALLDGLRLRSAAAAAVESDTYAVGVFLLLTVFLDTSSDGRSLEEHLAYLRSVPQGAELH